MGDTYLTDMAVQLRLDPYPVVELDDWQHRARGSGGYDGGPIVIMWHHTASSGDGAADADYCTYGSPDAPICNIVIGRDGTRHVCAGGATNTNGKGGPNTLPSGRVVPKDGCNSRAIGIEISNNGIGQSYPQIQIDACFATSNRLAAAYLGGRFDDILHHHDYAPDRKIDNATAAAVQGPWRPGAINSSGSWELHDLRVEALARARWTPPPPTSEEDDMPRYIYAVEGYTNTWSQEGIHLTAEAYTQMVADGAIVITSKLTWPSNQHLDSLLNVSGLNPDYLILKE
jgi:hypothetical protein